MSINRQVIQLSAQTPLLIDFGTEDGKVLFTSVNARDIGTHLANTLVTKGHRARLALLRDHIGERNTLAKVDPIAIDRNITVFREQLVQVVDTIAQRFGDILVSDGVLVVDSRYDDSPGFAGFQNIWRDYVYLFARVARLPA